MDIVKRLRRTELHHVWDDLEGKMVGKMFSANPDGPEAADEIERLRENAKQDAKYMLAYHRICQKHGIAPSSSELIEAMKEGK